MMAGSPWHIVWGTVAQKLINVHIFLLLFCLSPPGLLVVQARQAPARESKDLGVLEPNKPVQKDLAGGEVHSYHVTLLAGQYMSAVVDQLGIDVVVSVYDPTGKKVVEVDSPNGTQGPEPVKLIGATSGDYRLEIRSLDKGAPAGRYEARIEEIHGATQRDDAQIAAQAAYAEGLQLLTSARKPESMGKAVEKLDEALRSAQAAGDRRLQASVSFSLAAAYHSKNENIKTLEYLNQALPIWRELGDRAMEASTLNNIAMVYRSLGDLRKAFDYFNPALTISRAIGSRADEAEILTNMAAAYHLLGEERKALTLLDQALPALRVTARRDAEASALSSIGLVYDSLGEKQKALESYDRSLAIYRALGRLQGEAITLGNIGVLYDSIGEEQKALDCHRQALSLLRAAGDRSGEAGTLHNIGEVYESLGDKLKALSYYNEALAIQQALGERRNEAATLGNISLIYYWEAETKRALEGFNKVLLIDQEVGDRRGEAAMLHNIGLVYFSLGDKDKALEYYGRALPGRRAVEDRHGEAATLLNVGIAYYSMGEDQKALEHYGQALSLSQEVADRGLQANVHYRIALAQQRLGDLIGARSSLDHAMSMIESVRASVIHRDLRASYLGSTQQVYSANTQLLMQLDRKYPSQGYSAMALESSERARARSLLESLGESRVDIKQAVDPKLLERERSLQQLIDGKSQLQTLLLNKKHTEQQAVEIKREVEQLLTEYQDVEAEIRTASPAYAALTQPVPIRLKDIQQLLGPDELLLEYALGDPHSYLWAVTSSSISSYELPKGSDIDALANQLYDSLTVRDRRVASAHPDRLGLIKAADEQFQDADLRLSQILLGPVSGKLGQKRLLIAADGALHYVPFAVLADPASVANGANSSAPGRASDKSAPLVARHEVINLPSAATIAILRQENKSQKVWPKIAAVFADPVFDKDDPRVHRAAANAAPGDSAPRADASGHWAAASPEMPDDPFLQAVRDAGIVRHDGRLPRLIFSRAEANVISHVAGTEKVMLALDFDASTNRVKGLAGQYRIIHFATHALLNTDQPELSGLVLSLVDQNGHPQNGFLRLLDIYNLSLDADLVVLSACQTALGKKVKGEGLVGVTRGFMYAGVPRVIASLWNTDDEATAEFMKLFYEAMLKQGQRPAAALRTAQIALSANERWKSPYYWAPFILQGEWK